MSSTLFKTIALLLGIVFGASASMLVYVLALERPRISYKNVPYPPTSTQFKAGHTVPLVVDLCISGDEPLTYTVRRTLYNLETGQYTDFAPTVVRLEAGCQKVISYSNYIPSSASAGSYRFNGISVVPRLLGTFEVPWYSQPFEVVK